MEREFPDLILLPDMTMGQIDLKMEMEQVDLKMESYPPGLRMEMELPMEHLQLPTDMTMELPIDMIMEMEQPGPVGEMHLTKIPIMIPLEQSMEAGGIKQKLLCRDTQV